MVVYFYVLGYLILVGTAVWVGVFFAIKDNFITGDQSLWMTLSTVGSIVFYGFVSASVFLGAGAFLSLMERKTDAIEKIAKKINL
ncbi:hypothetical protein ACGTN9_18925 [Halobacillus sp. MO56]